MEAHGPSRYIIGLLGFTPESGQIAQNSSNMPLQCPGPEPDASLNLVPVLFQQKLSAASVIPPVKSRSNSPVLYFIVLSQLSSPLPEGILIRFSPDDIQGILEIVDGINFLQYPLSDVNLSGISCILSPQTIGRPN
jgi:hypothetical protein